VSLSNVKILVVWMSQLSEQSGLTVPTIKYYLREGLLHPGESVGATRAHYDESHVRRLRLVRALVEVAGMRIDDVRRVLEALDDETLSWHEALGSAHTRLAPAASGTAGDEEQERVEQLLARQGWRLDEGSTHRAALAAALASLTELGHAPSEELLDTYAEAVDRIAAHEVEALPEADRAAAAERAVVSTLLLEPVLLTMRRIAQENASRRRGG
jgi:DNA-binding transcriptional MerR regulator